MKLIGKTLRFKNVNEYEEWLKEEHTDEEMSKFDTVSVCLNPDWNVGVIVEE